MLTKLYLQRWARAYRDDRYHAAVDTNKGVEAMNKALKYNCLPKGKNITLSQLVSVLNEQFLRNIRNRTLPCQNLTNQIMIVCLRGRPRTVIVHCLSRIRKAAKFKEGSIK